MSNFHYFADAVARQVDALQGQLFSVDLGDDDIFDLYLSLFPEGTNPIFRERTEHDCGCCKGFLRNMGHLVSIQPDGTVVSIFDGLEVPEPYDTIAHNLAEIIRARPIKTLFLTKERSFGAQVSRELLEDKTVRTWNHFYATTPVRCLTNDVDTKRGFYDTSREMLTRSLDTFTLSALDTVQELIADNSLYRGAEHRNAVTAFRAAFVEINTLSGPRRDHRIALLATDPAVARFKNSVIGTLVDDLSTGTPLEDAVRMFESKVAPRNYKRPTALITESMVKSAMKTLQDNDLADSVERRFAKMSDVAVSDVLFANRTSRNVMRGKVESLLMDSVTQRIPKKISDADTMTIDEFIKNIVPNAEAIDLILDNKHTGNFVSLTAPVHEDAPPLFEWGNGFGWSYDGDVTDSIRERVKKAGGRVDCPFRISLSWFNTDDLDLHVVEPNKNRIYYANRRGLNGELDVDIIRPLPNSNPVENVFFSRVAPGTYKVIVDNFTKRSTANIGCEVEIDYLGASTTLSFSGGLTKCKPFATIAIVQDSITITPGPGVQSSSRSTDKWGISTKTRAPVSALMASPNHWGDRDKGNKHWFFILEGCLNPSPVRGIYNEFLAPELIQHRKVFEVLGSKSKCPVSDEQLSGVGFSSTKRDAVMASVSLRDGGQRTFTINF